MLEGVGKNGARASFWAAAAVKASNKVHSHFFFLLLQLREAATAAAAAAAAAAKMFCSGSQLTVNVAAWTLRWLCSTLTMAIFIIVNAARRNWVAYTLHEVLKGVYRLHNVFARDGWKLKCCGINLCHSLKVTTFRIKPTAGEWSCYQTVNRVLRSRWHPTITCFF